MSNAIILYYSKSGVTEKLAKRIQADLNCDILKIEPEEEYGSYLASNIRVAKESMKKITPAFRTSIPDLSGYSTILLGYPVWSQKPPAFVSDFMRHCNVKGKTVVPFATFGMTGVKWTLKTVSDCCTGANILHPFDYGIAKKDNYDEWIEKIHKL